MKFRGQEQKLLSSNFQLISATQKLIPLPQNPSPIPFYYLLHHNTSLPPLFLFLPTHSVCTTVCEQETMAAPSAESLMKMSANASSTLCNLNGSSRRPLPPVSHSTRRRRSNSSARVAALSSSFLGSVRLSSASTKLSTLQQRQQRRNFSVFAMAATAGTIIPLSLFLRKCPFGC